MDHDKQLAKMDPKLRAAYEKVMGTSHDSPPSPEPVVPTPAAPPVAPPPTPVEPVAPPPTPAPVEEAQTPPSPQPEISKQDVPASTAPVSASTADIPNPKPIEQQKSEMVRIGGSPVKQEVKPAQAASLPGVRRKGGSGMLTVIGLLVFFLIYTLICMKILGMSIPFLPK
jgi:hypothetical protein